MNCEIFIVSCAKHFDWLEYCLKSIGKFASGFSGVTVLVPQEPDYPMAVQRFFGRDFGPLPFRWPICGPEWPDKGMLWHMAQVMKADEWCPEADFILHTDSDCVFSEPVTPEDYFVNGKPVLYHERFKSLGKKHPDVLRWQEVVQKCVTFPVTQETMRRHPAVHPRKTYLKSREEIERKTRVNWEDYIRNQRNEFPQSFCEYVTLGNVGMHYFPNDYNLMDMEHQPWPTQKIVQFSSGNSPANVIFPPQVRQYPIVNGKPTECTPEDFLK